jgi:ribonucleoside-triphosphate reductase
MLYESFKNGILPAYSAGYIDLHQQFSTVGINGMNEAAEFMGITCSDNPDYQEFCNVITSIISKDNKENTDSEIKFNLEFVPAESLGVKNYSWDKEDGYIVPENRNCYNSYFYEPDDPTIDILQKFRLQGSRYAENCDGGVAFHANLDEHLSKKQYLKLIDYSIKEGCNYFTFNIPNSQCDDCGHIVKRPIKQCPECGSTKVTWWTRIIGYLRPISSFSRSRQEEASKRVYLHASDKL